jgi:hypothetical protein
MSDEGVTLIAGLWRFAVRIALLFAGAFVAELVGPSRRGRVYMAIGTAVGMSAGIAVASLMPRWETIDVSFIGACIGLFAGWGLAWLFARRIPREETG